VDFCEAGRIWSRSLSGLRPWEVIERYEIDGFPEEEDIEGACEWIEQAAGRFEEFAGKRGRWA
jgi:MioC protein